MFYMQPASNYDLLQTKTPEEEKNQKCPSKCLGNVTNQI
jgi:hypothetical protein